MNAPAEITVEQLRPDLWADPFWRLNNLYWIVDETGKPVRFKMNEEQERLYRSLHTRNLILKARQLGYTTLICLLALDQCLFNANFQAGIIAHNREDAEKFFRNKVMFAYDRLPEALKQQIPVTKKTESQVSFANGASLYVATSFRGGTLQLLHVSEFGKICRKYPDKAEEIVTGAFEAVSADNLIFVESTAEGMDGYFYTYSMEALRMQREGVPLSKLDYRLHFAPWYIKSAYRMDPAGVVISDSQARYFAEVEARLSMKFTPEQKAWWVKKKAQLMQKMGREYPATPEEAFEQAVEGAIFGEQMTWMRENGRITTVPLDPVEPVNTFWDFGTSDKTAIWLHQQVGLQNRFVRYFSDSGKGLRYYWIEVLEKWRSDNNARWGDHYLPHDADQDMQGEVVTTKRKELEKLRMQNIVVVPRVPSKDIAIDLLRNSLVRDVWIDRDGCADGVKCLDNYQFKWDDKRGIWSNEPYHNWASHGTDAIMQHAQGYKGDRDIESIAAFANRKRDWRG